MRLVLALVLLLIPAPAFSYDPIFHDAFQSTTDCPANVDVSGTVNYRWGTGSSHDNHMRDLRSMDAVFSLPGFPVRNLPWYQGVHPTIMALARHDILAMRFTAPAVVIPTQWGTIWHSETTPGPALTVAVSRYCGDFAPSQAACAKANVGPGGLLLRWGYPSAPGAHCGLVPGMAYYLNVRFANPAEVRIPDCGPNGTAPTCKLTFVSNTNP
jgi:hypothetical protein